MKPYGGLVLLTFVLGANYLTKGELIDSVAESDVQDAADEVLSASDDNAVAACFANEAGYGSLTEIETYAYYGTFVGVLDFNVDVGQTSISLHDNTLNLVGTAGLVCYHVSGTEYKVCAAYYTPFNDIIYDNQFNMKVYETSQTNNEAIFKHMLSDSAAWFESRAGQYAYRTEYGIDMRVTMDDRNKATLAVFVDSTGYNPFYGPDLHYGCSLYGIGKSCWRECDANNPGWQWTTQSCWNLDDCGDPNELIPDSECFIDGPW